jgi:hypothetical protein
VFDFGAGFVRHGGVFGVKFVVGGEFLELEQGQEGAAIDQVEAGFVAMDEVETAGIVGQGGEGGGKAFGLRGGGIQLVFEFLIEGSSFDGPEAAQAPDGGDHFLDEGLGGKVGGGETAEEILVEFAEGVGGLVGEEDAVGQDAVAEGIEGRAALALGGFGAAGECSVGAGGADATFGGWRFGGDGLGGGRLGRKRVGGEKVGGWAFGSETFSGHHGPLNTSVGDSRKRVGGKWFVFREIGVVNGGETLEVGVTWRSPSGTPHGRARPRATFHEECVSSAYASSLA